MARSKTAEIGDEGRILKLSEGKAAAVEFEAVARFTGSSIGLVVPAWLAKAMGLAPGDRLGVRLEREVR